MKVDVKRITINESEKASDSNLFVLNRAAVPGNVNMTISTPGGKVGVQAPITWIPFDLTVYAQKKDILGDPGFRRMIARNILVILDSAESEKFIAEHEKAQKELARLMNVADNIEVLGNDNPAVPVSQQINAVAPQQAGVSTFIENLVLRVGVDSTEDLLTELDSMAHTFTPVDVTYLMNNTTDAEIKAWCALNLEENR